MDILETMDFGFLDLLKGKIPSYTETEIFALLDDFNEEQRAYIWYNIDYAKYEYWDGSQRLDFSSPSFQLPQYTLFVSPNFTNTAPYFSTIQAAQDFAAASGEAYNYLIIVFKGTYNERIQLQADTHCMQGVVIANSNDSYPVITNQYDANFTGFATIRANNNDYCLYWWLNEGGYAGNKVRRLEFERIEYQDNYSGSLKYAIYLMGYYYKEMIIKGTTLQGKIYNDIQQSDSDLPYGRQLSINIKYLDTYIDSSNTYEYATAMTTSINAERVKYLEIANGTVYANIKTIYNNSNNLHSIVVYNKGILNLIDCNCISTITGNAQVYSGGVLSCLNCNFSHTSNSATCIELNNTNDTTAKLKLKNTTLVTGYTYSIEGNDNTYCVVNASGGGNSSNKTYNNVDWNGLALQVNTEIEI